MLSESQTLSHNKNKEADMSDLFKNHGIQIKGILSLTPRETHDLVSRGAFLIDLRDIDFVDYKAFDVPNVLNLPLNGFEKHLKNWIKKVIIFWPIPLG
jgi:hypothetical protein